ncbi:MAG: beta-lactamase family protein [Proteobacteria bacterium]|nr:beta-lactamase family protein [Pseudomonadota bacterium]
MSNPAAEAGMSSERIARAGAFIQGYIDARKHFGAEIIVARNGKIALHEAFGYRDQERRHALKKGAVYTIFSVSKSFTSVLALAAIEKGLFSLTTKVSEIIPEFRGGRRENITAYHLLTHQSGLPMAFTPVQGMYIDRLDEVIAAICKSAHCESDPGVEASYSPTTNHCLLGEMVRRVDPKKRRFRDIARQDLFEPLKLHDTSFGLRPDMRERHIKPVWLFDKSPLKHLGHSDFGTDGAFEEEDAEMPWVGVSCTASDLYRFAEMMRRGGELDGARILSPVTTEQMRWNRTGEKINLMHGRQAVQRGWDAMPAYSGLGVFLRGTTLCHHQFGTFTSAQTFGQHGQGSALYWVDPVHQVTFVFLSHGVMNEGESVERFQRLSDLVITSVV